MNRRSDPYAPARHAGPRGSLWLGVIVVVAALVLLVGVLYLRAEPEPAVAQAPASVPGTTVPPAPVKSPSTPIFSSRRIPDFVRARVADASVEKLVMDATKDEPPSSCVVITDRGRVIYELNGDVPLLPASINKLATAVTALKVLGPGTRLQTTVRGPAPGPDGAITGDVYLVGGGDPLLYTAGFQMTREYRDQPFNDFNQLADRIKAAGVTRINGNLLGDDSRYDTERAVATWPPDYQRDEQVGALSALQVNWGETGLENDPNKPTKVRKLGDPPAAAVQTLKTLLEQRGIKVTGLAVSGSVPPGPALTDIATLDSPTVSELVDEMLSFSDNNTAELLTKEIGLKARGKGSTAIGTAVITDHLRELGLPMGGVLLVDGSGLDRNDRVTCNLIAALLDKVGPGSELANAMAVVGQKGTLKKRMKGQFADGRVRAKTGTLKDVVALAGFEKTLPGSDLTFVSIQNGNSKPGIRVQDDIINGLLAYPQAPDLATIGPKSGP
ncbi:MAG: D-alanyl-D-alanine carboxypeptidase/D-alanyl-D-alanine-endopeptidase [Actinobacteria bacterium]|nr:D-alanyl-D-alanine carboxypeptidase/D-alanyl-D-alanine-endopeptidase [Actinomycetota bacterium]